MILHATSESLTFVEYGPFITELVKENPAMYEILTDSLVVGFETGLIYLEEPKFYISLATLA